VDHCASTPGIEARSRRRENIVPTKYQFKEVFVQREQAGATLERLADMPFMFLGTHIHADAESLSAALVDIVLIDLGLPRFVGNRGDRLAEGARRPEFRLIALTVGEDIDRVFDAL
jgi:hypothetical protein